jgi:hypothetical protein
MVFKTENTTNYDQTILSKNAFITSRNKNTHFAA